MRDESGRLADLNFRGDGGGIADAGVVVSRLGDLGILKEGIAACSGRVWQSGGRRGERGVVEY